MWKTKTWPLTAKGAEAFAKWKAGPARRYQWEEIAVNNRLGVTYRKLRVIG